MKQMTPLIASRAVSAGVAATRGRAALAASLVEALMAPATADEMADLLADLCTPAEAKSLAERWHVARLLDEGRLTYREIHDATGVSTTTIVRVARFLRHAPHQGYRRVIDRLERRPEDSSAR